MFKHLKTYFTHTHSLALGAAFWSVGFLFGNWATFIPHIKLKFNLNDAELGLLLLSLPFGAMTFNPVAAFLINKFGMRKTHIIGFFLLPIFYAIPLNTNLLPVVSAGLVLTGMGISFLNVAMNTCATAVEHQDKINIMSTSHGMFSIGLMLGSVVSSFAIGLGVLPSYSMLAAAALVLVLWLITRPIIMELHEEPIEKKENATSVAKFSLPKGALLTMILISICTNVTEGAMADWTAVYMRDVVHTNPYFIGWGLAGYSFFMAMGRFVGDGLIPRIGQNKILIGGGIIASIGIIISIVLPFTFSSIAGFALVGAGVSCAAPILYGSAARVPNMAKGAGLATMNTFSMAGFLLGPVVIGFISKAVSLPFAFGLVAILAFMWSVLSRKVKLY